MEDVCLKRCSCREFQKKQIPEWKICKIFKAAMQAPSARNEQPWEFILIKNEDTKMKVSQISDNFSAASGAECIILLMANSIRIRNDSPWWIQDMSACAENILVQAADMGLGAVWLGIYPREDRIEAVKQLMKIPETVTPFAFVLVGYPAKEIFVKARYDEKRVYKEVYGGK